MQVSTVLGFKLPIKYLLILAVSPCILSHSPFSPPLPHLILPFQALPIYPQLFILFPLTDEIYLFLIVPYSIATLCSSM